LSRLFDAVIVGCVAVVASAHAGGTDYTGFWKRNCSDGFGVQIKPADGALYSVSFCGPGGCFAPGTWTPDTRIEGDPNYKVISPKEIGIRRSDKGEYSTYLKCDSDPTWEVAAPAAAESRTALDCSPVPASKDEGVLIGWITDVRTTSQSGEGSEGETTEVQPFRPIALLKGALLTETPGAGIHTGQSFWRVLGPDTKPVKLRSVGSFLDHMNEDHCVYFGTFGKDNPPRWTLLSSQPLAGRLRAPSSRERAEYQRLNTACVEQGDYPDGQTPPCSRPELLAVSDIDKDGKPEYWATEPYRWDTGLTVWENSGTLTPLLQVCVGCSD